MVGRVNADPVDSERNLLDLNALANIGEALGGLAILLSLIYVGVELRLNTRSNRARTSYEGAHSWAEINSQLMAEPVVAAALTRSMEEDDPVLTDEERAQLHFAGRSAFERLDALYYLYRNKQLEPELWATRVTWARRMLDRPYWRSWRASERDTSNYSPLFLEELDREPPDGGPI